MLCDECQQRDAKVHITKIIKNKKITVHLCNECAGYQKTQSSEFDFEPGFSIHKLFAGLLDDDLDIGQSRTSRPRSPAKVRCEKCGLTYEEFVKYGRLGCGECYETFREKLEPMFSRIHGSSYHTGKIPEHAGESIRYNKKIEALKSELKELIAQERFEEAAEIRDRIRELERELSDLSSGGVQE